MFPNGVEVSAVCEPAVESSGDDLSLHGVTQTFDWDRGGPQD